MELSFEHLLNHLILHHAKALYFVQIGAFDGISGDPLYPFVKQGFLKGCLVEPQAYAFERLPGDVCRD
jgi:hypothetical protein